MSRHASLFLLLALTGCGVVAPLDDVDPATGSGLQSGAGQGGAGAGGGQGGAGAGGAGTGGAGTGQGGAGQAGEGGAGSAGAEQGGAGAGQGECETCATEQCGNELLACLADPACADCLVKPTVDCKDNAAVQGIAACACDPGLCLAQCSKICAGVGGAGGAGGGGAGGAGGGGEGGAGAGGSGGDAGASGAGAGGSGGGSTEDGVGELDAPCSKPGALACNGHAQILKLICKDGKWQEFGTCDNDTLCNTQSPGAGSCKPIDELCAARAPGEAFCDSTDRVVCNLDLTGTTKTTCSSPQHCQLSQGATCAACLDGEFTCVGQKLQKCSDDHLSFVDVKTCVDPQQCNAGAGDCTDTVCVADQYQCQGDELQKCTADLKGFAKAETCLQGLCDAIGKQCDACVPGQTGCKEDGVTRLVCSADGQKNDEETCAGSTPFCDKGECVACKVDSDCSGAGECQTVACQAGVCVFTKVTQGVALAEQTAGDCQKRVCDGNGGQESVADDTDKPADDGTVCTTEACEAGAPKINFAAKDTACEGGEKCDEFGTCGTCTPGDKRCVGNDLQSCGADSKFAKVQTCSGTTPFCAGGTCVACNVDADCPATGNECTLARCSGGSCVAQPKTGTPLASQTAGDCKTAVCDSNGGTTTQANPADLPTTTNECETASCSGDTPTFTPKPVSTPCSGGICNGVAPAKCGVCAPGARQCSGNSAQVCGSDGQWTTTSTCSLCSGGQCVGCVTASDCAAPGECQTVACNANTCQYSNKADGTVLATQTAGDCKERVCQGGAVTTVAKSADLPADDGNPCTDPACNGSTPSFTNKAAGTTCNGTGVCTGTGICGVCLPGNRKCSGSSVQTCNGNGQYDSSACAAPTPYCKESGGSASCVACTQNSHCSPTEPACQTGSCTSGNTCQFVNKPASQACGDGIKCSFEACDDGDSYDCGYCNKTCSGPGNGLPFGVCKDSCADGSADEIVTSSLVACKDSRPFSDASSVCGVGFSIAPYEAWVAWRGAEVPDQDYWVTGLDFKPAGSSGNCTVIPNSGTKCGDAALVCGSSSSCQVKDCGVAVPTQNQYLGGCSSSGQAGTLCWRNPCTAGKVDQYFLNGMVGCAAKEKFANRAGLCGVGYHVCSLSEYLSRRGNNPTNNSPTHVYWTSTDTTVFVKDLGVSGCSISGNSSVGDPCEQPVKACPDSGSDSEGNDCGTPVKCGFESTVNQGLGCKGTDFAGALCCADSPCADGSVEQVFVDNMVGCSGSVIYENRAALCGEGYRVASAKDWVKYRGGLQPSNHYWVDDNLYGAGTDSACSVAQPGTSGYSACAADKGPMHVCSSTAGPNHPDSKGNTCARVKCGDGANNPNEFFGGCAAGVGPGTAGTLCIPK